MIKKSTHKDCGRLTEYYLIKLSYINYKIYTTGLIDILFVYNLLGSYALKSTPIIEINTFMGRKGLSGTDLEI